MTAEGSAAELLLDALARATTPAERLAGGWVRTVPGPLADERYRTWLTRVTSGDDARAAAILAARGLTPDEFRRGLCEVARVPGDPPAWASDAVAMLLAVEPPAPGTQAPRLGEIVGTALPTWVDADQPWRFHSGFHSWLATAEADVRTWAAAHGAPLSDDTITDLARGLARRLLDLAGPLLMAEFGAQAPGSEAQAQGSEAQAQGSEAQAPGSEAQAQGPASGSGAQASGFGAEPAQVWLQLWLDHPVLARSMAVSARQWRTVTEEMIARIGLDLPRLGAAGRTVVGVSTGAGDQHREGRGVAVVDLDDGTRWFLKPRNDRVHHLLEALLQVTGLNGGDVGLRLPELVDGEGYVWAREVAAGDAEDIGDYFRRAGALLRLMQAVGATDLHHENLMPAPDQPVLVDLETVFGPPAGWAADDDDGTTDTAPLTARMADTPGRTSMLGSPVSGLPGLRSADIGGLAGPHETLSPYRVQTLEASPAGPRLVSARVPLANGAALPRRGGRPVGLTGYEQDLLTGFASADGAIRRAPAAVAAATAAGGSDGAAGAAGVVRGSAAAVGAAAVEVRFVARATQIYARLLRSSLAPLALTDGVDRELVLERLWRAFGTCPAVVIEAEQLALRELDVPMFTIPFASTDLITDRGDVLGNVLRASPAAELARRWAAVGERDDHLDDVRADLFAMAPADLAGPAVPTTAASAGSADRTTAASAGSATAASAGSADRTTAVPAAEQPPSMGPDASSEPAGTAAQLLSAGAVLAERVVVLGDGSLTWTGLAYDPAHYVWRHQRLAPGLLGDAGVALALLTAGTVWEQAPADWLEIGHRGLLSAAARCATGRPTADAFTNAAGTLYAVATGARLTGSPELLAAAEALVPAALAPTAERAALYGLESAAAATLALAALPGGTDAYADHLVALLAAPTPTGPIDSPPDGWAGTMPSGPAGVVLALRALGRPAVWPNSAIATAGPNPADPAAVGTAFSAAGGTADPTTVGATDAASTAEGADLTPGDAAALAHVPGVAEHFWQATWSLSAPAHVLLDCAEVARAATRAGAVGPWPERTRAAAELLVARRTATGSWFGELLAPDSRMLSAVQGLGAIVLLGAALWAAPHEPSAALPAAPHRSPAALWAAPEAPRIPLVRTFG